MSRSLVNAKERHKKPLGEEFGGKICLKNPTEM